MKVHKTFLYKEIKIENQRGIQLYSMIKGAVSYYVNTSTLLEINSTSHHLIESFILAQETKVKPDDIKKILEFETVSHSEFNLCLYLRLLQRNLGYCYDGVIIPALGYVSVWANHGNLMNKL